MIDWIYYQTHIQFSEKERTQCWNLIRIFYRREYGIFLPSYDKEFFKSNDKRIPSLIEKESKKWIKTENPAIGDVVLFLIKGRPRHVGIVKDVKKKKMLHCLKGSDTVIELYNSLEWKNRVKGFYKHTDRC